MTGPGRRATRTAFINHKGGVGKSTTVGQTAHRAARRGLKVLIAECDPQGNSTLAFTDYTDDNDATKPPCSLADVLDRRTRRPVTEAIVHTHREGLDILPGGFKDLQAVADNLISQMGADHSLSNALEAVDDYYDHILFDCRPASDLITRNAMVAADNAVIVTQALSWANHGLKEALASIDDMRLYLGKDLPVAGFVINMYQSTRNDQATHRDWLQTVAQAQNIPILGLPVPFYVELARLAENGMGLDEHPKENAKMRVIAQTYDAILDAIGAHKPAPVK